MKKILVVLLCVLMFFLGACSAGMASAEQENSIKIWPHNQNGHMRTWVVEDDVTGVNYIVVATDNHNGGVAITPRIYSDGAIYVTQ